MSRLSRIIMISSACFLMLCTLLAAVKHVAASDYVFARSLKLGANGEDVRQLQKVLNSDVDTMVQSAGAGSPGQETTYFGLLTQNAVIRFQEKYREEILIPNGLSSGTGFVGASTLKVIAGLSAGTTYATSGSQTSNSSATTYSVGSNVSTQTSAYSISSTSPAMSTANSPAAVSTNLPTAAIYSGTSVPALSPGNSNVNPNLKNLDKFLSALDRASARKGISPQAVSKMKNQIMLDIATTTNLQSAFLNIVRSANATSTQVQASLFRTSWRQIVSSIEKIFLPNPVLASISTPFGGQLYYAYFCDCSENWEITVEPLAPTYIELLTYYEGTQLYLTYNIPFTTELLGFYNQGPECLVYIGVNCATVTSEGDISPTVGSSAI